jgi:hypothetical protein
MAVAVGAAGYSLQAAGLRRAPQANVVASHAATWLLRYRFAASTLHLDNRTMHGQCFNGRIEGRRDRPARGTVLILDNGTSVRAFNPNTLLSQGPRALPAFSALELAGCTQVLGTRIASLAQFDNHLRLRRLAGRHAFALDFQQLTLVISAKADRPLGVTLGDAVSSIRLSRVTTDVARAFESFG